MVLITDLAKSNSAESADPVCSTPPDAWRVSEAHDKSTTCANNYRPWHLKK